eukprot:11203870-Lingulodinium_polyedra.AAC.1
MYRSGSATTSPGRGAHRMVAMPTCTCRRSAKAAGGRLRIAAGVHCRWVRLPPPAMARALIIA